MFSPDPYPSSSPVYGAILAAGLGTRLRPMTYHKPKPLVPVFGRPLIEWGMLALAKTGVKSLGVNAYHLGAQLQKELDFQKIHQELACSHNPQTISLSVVDETELLGTGGGLKGIWRELGITDPSAVMVSINGDALFDFSLTPLLETHFQYNAVGTLALRPVEADDPFGRIGVDADGRVVRIAEVTGPLSHTEVRVGAFTGAQVITKEVIDRVPEGFCDIFRSAHRTLLENKQEIRAHFVDSKSMWVDVGNMERYLAAHQALLEKKNSPLWSHVPQHKFDRGAVLFKGASLSSQLKSAHNLWLGQDASLNGVNEAKNVVLWPGLKINVNESELNDEVFIIPSS